MFALLSIVALLGLATAAPASPWGPQSGVRIVAQTDAKCLGVNATAIVGSPVSSVNCSDTAYNTLWDINLGGSGSVILSGTDLALDAGENPGNNGALKVWTSYPGLYQQTWYFTKDARVAITGGDQCLDEGEQGIQTWKCTTDNTNQIFNIASPPRASSAVLEPSSPATRTASVDSWSTGPVTTAAGSPASYSPITTITVDPTSAGPITTVASGSLAPSSSPAA